METPDRGWPGAEYRVRLQVAGKWRTVTWERISEKPTKRQSALSDDIAGSYFVTGSFNYWDFLKMSPDMNTLGLYEAEVTLTDFYVFFQILRNKDWQQAFFPNGIPNSSDAIGPSDEGQGVFFCIHGRPGEVYKIQFQRCQDPT